MIDDKRTNLEQMRIYFAGSRKIDLHIGSLIVVARL